MQYYITKDGEQNILVQEDKGNILSRFHVRTEEDIGKMSFGSLKGYRKKAKDLRGEVHNMGTTQAIRSIDYVNEAVRRVWSEKHFDEKQETRLRERALKRNK